MTAWFSVRGGRLRVTSEDPAIEWSGTLDGMPVRDLVVLPSGSSAVVLLDPPPGHGAVRNLVRVDSNAKVAWRAEPPKPGESDAFVSIALLEDGLISASTWSGYRVVISPDTGAVIRMDHTK
jgi:hypothetical protein